METKTQHKKQRDIKSKLVAAVAMLLVSSIMMVSSTYAWFTLSTAPEVTGINTAVGANGNLEMALLPKSGNISEVVSAAGDHTKPIAERNVTWGNLVDLSDSSVYGLDNITLYPAALNGVYSEGKWTSINSIFLKTPQYGADGRVSELTPNTVTGYYDSTEKDFYPNAYMGVRGVGTASGMTDRQLTYRNALSAANTAMAQAKTLASQSLNSNGSALANIAIKHATNSPNDTYDSTDVASLQAIVDDLLGTEGKTGALEYIETAYKQYILAYAASAAGGADTVYQAVKAVVDSGELGNVTSAFSGSLPDAFTGATSGLNATKGKVEGAKTDLASLNGDNVPWSSISTALYKLANVDAMKVNGIAASEIKTGDNMSTLVNSVATGGLKVTMSSDGGVYADIADHCGNYTAQVVIEEVTYSGLTLKNMTARMETASTVTAYLTAANTAVTAAGAPASGNATNMPITDMYGYVIDLVFRTNAAESKLLLQQEAVDRIYSDNSNAATMGGGSNMTFAITGGGITEAQLKELMGAIRIVFFKPAAGDNTSNEVVAVAGLDAANATQVAEGYKAKIVLGSMTENGVFTAGTGNELMPLTQNTAAGLSVLVYLDGNMVGNEDVAAAVATSMTGKMNLQFASSATLVPMDYSQLHTPATSGGTTASPSPTPGATPTADPSAEG